ncbi:MAG: MotA/TolQ/ExbB proton channel family protein [Spirochaetaceae bacterium]|jgi:biopolymer transport protein ExbB|nr:MotA/TolQ/ExbB proton channel family protein [Spirochaetaceae bacterium]
MAFSLLALFKMGGAFMWPLLFFSVVTVAITLERAFFLLYHNLRLDDLEEQVSKCIRTGNLAKAKENLELLSKRRMGARVLLTMVNRAAMPESQLEKAVEAEAMACITDLESGFNFLTALGSLSPLTGFLGTVSGMIGAFRSIAEAEDVSAQIVAGGIYEALVTTAFGLAIAIIAMVAHSLFSYVVDKFASDTERTCSNLILELALTNKKPAPGPTFQRYYEPPPNESRALTRQGQTPPPPLLSLEDYT